MRFFLDENSAPNLANLLTMTFTTHGFGTSRDEGLTGMDDEELFSELSTRGYGAIITNDRRQLIRDNERAALIREGIHWVGHTRVKVAGPKGFAMTAGGLLAGMPFVVDQLAQVDRPHAFRLKGVETLSNQRVTIEPL